METTSPARMFVQITEQFNKHNQSRVDEGILQLCWSIWPVLSHCKTQQTHDQNRMDGDDHIFAGMFWNALLFVFQMPIR